MASVVVGIVGLLASAKTAHHFLAPRLPVYEMEVQGIPTLSYSNGEVATRVVANVSMRNDNYMKLDIHGVSFDIFYPEWSSSNDTSPSPVSLVHVARAIDKYQHAAKKSNVTKAAPAFWSLSPRADFSTIDEVYVTMSPVSGFTTLIGAVSNLMYRIVYETKLGTATNDTIILPSTGVMHARANSAAKVTISIVCDNTFDIWTLRMVGTDCIFNSLDIGWKNITQYADKVQQKALSTLQPNATASVLAFGKKARKKSDEIATKLLKLAPEDDKSKE